MKVELELWHLILLLLAFFSCVGVFGKVLLDQFEKRLEQRFKTYDESTKKNTGALEKLERDFLEFKAELPINYVRREDFVRGQSVIEAKLDALYNKLEVVQMKGMKNG